MKHSFLSQKISGFTLELEKYCGKIQGRVMKMIKKVFDLLKKKKKKSVYLTEKSNLMTTSSCRQDNTETNSGRVSIQQTST